LEETKSLVRLLDEVRGTEEEPEIRRRLKAMLPQVIEELWLLPQVFSRQRVVLHVQFYFRGGRMSYFTLGAPARPGDPPIWELSGSDFRAGYIVNVAGDTQVAPELPR